MVARSGSGRAGSYTGSSGPRHCSQIATGAAARPAPQLLQRSGRARGGERGAGVGDRSAARDRKSTRLNSSHRCISYAVFCLKKKKKKKKQNEPTNGQKGIRHTPAI